MTFKEFAAGFIRYKAARGMSPRTGESYDRSFDQFRAFLAPRGLNDDIRHFTPANVSAFATFAAESGMKSSSVNNRLAALSSLGAYGVRAQDARGKYLLAENPVDRVERPKKSKPSERYLYAPEIRALLAVEAPAHERLALALLFDTSLRASAAVGAKVRDLSIDGDDVRLQVREKGDKPRVVVLSPDVAEVLLDSLKFREASADDRLLVNTGGRPYTRTTLSEMIARLARKAGITRINVRAHLFARHSPASLAGQNGMTAPEIAAMLGHADMSTVQKYVHGVSGDAARGKVRALLEVK